MTRPAGRRARKVIAMLVGVGAAIAACVGAYLLIFAHVIGDLARAGEAGRVWWILAFVGLVIGSGAYSLTLGLLERRARRADEDARLPRARIDR